MTTQLSTKWLTWINENLKQGCTPQSMMEVMIKEGIDAESAEQAILRAIKGKIDNLNNDIPAYQYIYEASHIKSGNKILLSDREVNIAFRMTQPDVVLMSNFLSDDECEALIQQAKLKLKPSTVIDNKKGGSVTHDARTSEGMSFKLGENELIQKLECRISELVNIPIENGEAIQVLHYREGAEYKPHYDFFPASETGGKSHLKRGGQRVVTVVMYLNDVEEGGETIFPDLKLSIIPQRGSALYFSYCNKSGQTDENTLHGGRAVITGDKWIATKWIRQNKYKD